MNSIKKIIVMLLSFCSSCVSRECKNISEIYVSELLIVTSDKRGYNYCSLLESSLEKNKLAIKKFSLLDFKDGAGYDHGSAIIDLIRIIGEDEYIKAIDGISVNEKLIIKAYIEVGLQYYGDTTFSNKTMIDIFPNLQNFLGGN